MTLERVYVCAGLCEMIDELRSVCPNGVER